MPKRGDPWFKMYPQDWIDGTRDMTLEQRAAYIDMLCLQYLYEAPVKDDLKWLSHQLHISTRKARVLVTSLVDELKKMERSREGLSCSRASKEIAAKIEQRRINAENRANQSRTNDEPAMNQRRTSDEPTTNQPQKRREKSENTNDFNGSEEFSFDDMVDTRARVDSDTDIEKEYICAADTAPPAKPDDPFDEFWKAFPKERKRGKAECRDLFKAIVSGRHKRKATTGEIIHAVRAGWGIDPKFPPMPKTWLFQGRWEDKPDDGKTLTPSMDETNAKLKRMSDKEQLDLVKQHANGRWPQPILGEPPGHPKCVIRPEIYESVGITTRTYDDDGLKN